MKNLVIKNCFKNNFRNTKLSSNLFNFILRFKKNHFCNKKIVCKNHNQDQKIGEMIESKDHSIKNITEMQKEIKLNEALKKFRKIFSVNTMCLISEINKQIMFEELEFKKSFNPSYKRILFEQGYNRIEMNSYENLKIYKTVEMFDVEIKVYKYVLNENVDIINELIEESQNDVLHDEMEFFQKTIGTSYTYEDKLFNSKKQFYLVFEYEKYKQTDNKQYFSLRIKWNNLNDDRFKSLNSLVKNKNSELIFEMYLRNEEIIIEEIVIEDHNILNDSLDQSIKTVNKIRFDILNDYVQTKIIDLINTWFIDRNKDIKLIKFLGLYIEHKYYIKSLASLNTFIST